MKKKLKPNGVSPQRTFDGERLKKALLFWDDVAERCLLPFCVAGQTARDMVDEKELSGGEVSLAVQKKHLTHEVWSTLRTLVPKHTLIDNRIELIYEGVPIRVEIKENDDPYITNPDFKFFWSWEYKIPNPFEEYWKTWK